MTKPPTHDPLEALLEELADLVDKLRHGIRIEALDDGGRANGHELTISATDLMSLAAAAKRDGYATSSGLQNGPSSSLGDPTGDVAAAVADGVIDDPLQYLSETVLRTVSGARGDLRTACNALMCSTRLVATCQGEPGCRSCETIGQWTPVRAAGRCRWCYDFSIAQGVDPPEDLLQARAAGKRISQWMIDQALAKPKKRRSRQSRR
jgi:hypothetical protein